MKTHHKQIILFHKLLAASLLVFKFFKVKYIAHIIYMGGFSDIGSAAWSVFYKVESVANVLFWWHNRRDYAYRGQSSKASNTILGLSSNFSTPMLIFDELVVLMILMKKYIWRTFYTFFE